MRDDYYRCAGTGVLIKNTRDFHDDLTSGCWFFGAGVYQDNLAGREENNVRFISWWRTSLLTESDVQGKPGWTMAQHKQLIC